MTKAKLKAPEPRGPSKQTHRVQFTCRVLGTLLSCLLASTAEADFSVHLEQPKLHFTLRSFEGVVNSFIGDYSEGVQGIWSSIDLSDPESELADTEVDFIGATAFSFEKRWPLAAESPFFATLAVGKEVSNFYFPEGILPFIDPITYQNSTFWGSGLIGVSIVDFDLGPLQLVTEIGAGQRVSYVFGSLTSALLNVRDDFAQTETVVMARQRVQGEYVGASLSLQSWDGRAPELDFRLSLPLR